MQPGSPWAANATWMLGQAYNQSMAVPPNPLYQPMYSQQVYSPSVSPLPGSGFFGEDVSMLMNMGVQMAPMLLGAQGYAGNPFGPTMLLSDRMLNESRRTEISAIARAMGPGDVARMTPMFAGAVRMMDPSMDAATAAGKGAAMADWFNRVATDPTSPGRMMIGQMAAMGVIPMGLMDQALPSFYTPEQLQQLNERRYSAGKWGGALTTEQMAQMAKEMQSYFKPGGRNNFGFSLREAGEMALSLEARGLLPSYTPEELQQAAALDKAASMDIGGLGLLPRYTSDALKAAASSALSSGHTRMFKSTRGMLEAHGAVVDAGLIAKDATSEQAIGAIQTITGGGVGHMSEQELVNAVNRFKEIQRMTGIAVGAMANIINGVAQLARENNLDPTAMAALAGESLLMGKAGAVNLNNAFGLNLRAGVTRDPVALAGVIQERQAAAATSMFSGRLANIQQLIDNGNISEKVRAEYKDVFDALASVNTSNPQIAALLSMSRDPTRAIAMFKAAGLNPDDAAAYIDNAAMGRVNAGRNPNLIRVGIAAQVEEAGGMVRTGVSGLIDSTASDTDLLKAAFVATAVKDPKQARAEVSKLLGGGPVSDDMFNNLQRYGTENDLARWVPMAYAGDTASMTKQLGGRVAGQQVINTALGRESMGDRLWVAVQALLSGGKAGLDSLDYLSQAKLRGSLANSDVGETVDKLRAKKDRSAEEEAMLNEMESTLGKLVGYKYKEGGPGAAEQIKNASLKAREGMGAHLSEADKDIMAGMTPEGKTFTLGDMQYKGMQSLVSAAASISGMLSGGLKMVLVASDGRHLGEALLNAANNAAPGTPASATQPAGGSGGPINTWLNRLKSNYGG
jgi:hypothetical protein